MKRQTDVIRYKAVFFGLALSLVAFFILDLVIGSTHLDISDVFRSLFGKGTQGGEVIIMQFRLPKALTAIIAGAAVSVSGLLMQTLFRNPLAGPDVMGVSSGAGMGVALMVLTLSPFIDFNTLNPLYGWSLIIAACLGAAAVMLIIMIVSARVRDIMTVLIIGILIASAVSSVVSLLQYFSNETMLKTYVIWTMGNLGNLSPVQIKALLLASFTGLIIAFLQVKKLNALLMGETFSKTVGVNIRSTRILLFAAASILVGSVTAFCGPLAFIGIAVPHIARLLFGTADHKILIPGTFLSGAIIVLFSDIISTLPGGGHIIPVNTVTSLVGIPVVLWIILGKKGVGIRV
jgi:iron complex transport system permease protein